MRLNFSRCPPAAARKRRIFWATQPDCGVTRPCPDELCGIPGLKLVDVADCRHDCHNPCPDHATIGQTIETRDWVCGLVLNILLTDGRRADRSCGWRPGLRGGHWSDSFRGDGMTAGSLVRLLDVKCSIAEATALVRAQVQSDLARLVQWEVAREVRVDVTYRGRNVISIEIGIVGDGPDVVNVGMTAQRLKNGWVWDYASA